jgi:hypothetical protein
LLQGQLFSRLLPIVSELWAMSQRPFNDHDMGSAWQLTTLDVQCVNGVNGFKIAVLGMEDSEFGGYVSF